MVAVDWLAKEDLERCLEWFAHTVAPAGADLRELGLGNQSEIKQCLRKLRAALEAHALDPFIQLLALTGTAAAFPALAPHTINPRARYEASRIATLVFAAACVMLPAVLVPSRTKLNGRPTFALAHTTVGDSPLGIVVPGYRTPCPTIKLFQRSWHF
ncbi:hypothetical protein H9P43_006680 [Blastocladiella emersonii ATCC 22665]|nr:hypothetical protein H9P43_006680 [Blastocladiella emersonii ATCC 22665]